MENLSNGDLAFPARTRLPGLLEAAREDLAPIYAALERTLDDREFLSGTLSIADLALFPHLISAFLDLAFDAATHLRLLAWFKRLRPLPVFAADLERTEAFLRDLAPDLPRPASIVWRGDRLEWVLARGFHEWFFEEIRQGRVAWPRASSTRDSARRPRRDAPARATPLLWSAPDTSRARPPALPRSSLASSTLVSVTG